MASLFSLFWLLCGSFSPQTPHGVLCSRVTPGELSTRLSCSAASNAVCVAIAVTRGQLGVGDTPVTAPGPPAPPRPSGTSVPWFSLPGVSANVTRCQRGGSCGRAAWRGTHRCLCFPLNHRARQPRPRCPHFNEGLTSAQGSVSPERHCPCSGFFQVAPRADDEGNQVHLRLPSTVPWGSSALEKGRAGREEPVQGQQNIPYLGHSERRQTPFEAAWGCSAGGDWHLLWT